MLSDHPPLHPLPVKGRESSRPHGRPGPRTRRTHHRRCAPVVVRSQPAHLAGSHLRRRRGRGLRPPRRGPGRPGPAGHQRSDDRCVGSVTAGPRPQQPPPACVPCALVLKQAINQAPHARVSVPRECAAAALNGWAVLLESSWSVFILELSQPGCG